MIKTRVIQNRILPFRGFSAITLFGLVFTRDKRHIDQYLLNHELIHCQQQREWLYLPFFIIYIAQWLWYLALTRDPKRAYKSIAFEREAYENERNLDYLATRPLFATFRRKRH